jgi:very-short-patch-repair endonuclease
MISGQNTWCPICKNKTEQKLYESLKNNFRVLSQVKFGWCKNKETEKYLPYDFVIEEFKLIIELDGGQHFKQVMNWKSPEEQQQRDLYKMQCANNNGYTVIRILQEDVWMDKNDWLEKLSKCLHKYETPTRMYISSGNEYQTFIDFDNTIEMLRDFLQ